jgi:LysR family glycine cleavage system transcriptional activator
MRMRRLVRRLDRLQRLAVFEAAARLGSFSAAARELGMTQPAVTRQVRALERAVDEQLFVRTANRSDLTAAGARFHSAVASGFDAIERGLAELDETTGVFVLAATQGLAEQVLVPNLQRLADAVHDVDLRLWLYDRDSDLRPDDYDAATRFGAGPWDGLRSRLLFPERVVPVATPTLAAAHGLDADAGPAQIVLAPLLHIDEGDREWMSWGTWLAAFGVPAPTTRRRVVFNNYPMVLRQAIAGNGVALGWRVVVDELVASGVLTVVGPEVRTANGYHLTWPPGRAAGPVTALGDAIIDLVGDGTSD